MILALKGLILAGLVGIAAHNTWFPALLWGGIVFGFGYNAGGPIKQVAVVAGGSAAVAFLLFTIVKRASDTIALWILLYALTVAALLLGEGYGYVWAAKLFPG